MAYAWTQHKDRAGNVVEVIREPLPRRAARRQTPAAQACDHLRCGDDHVCRAREQRRPPGRRVARASRAGARTPRRHRHGELRRVPAGPLRHLAGRHGRRANERQAAREGDRVHSRECRLRGLLLYARCGGQARAARHLQVEATRHRLDADEGLCRTARIGPDRRGVQRGRGRSLAVLHQRDHRPSQGGRALPPQPAVHVALLLRRHRSS